MDKQYVFGDITLPEDWYNKTGSEKIGFFNEKQLTPSQLLGAGAGITQSDIDSWRQYMGYNVFDPAPAPAPITAKQLSYFTDSEPGYTYQDLIADTTSAPAPAPTPQEMAARIGKTLPTDWGVVGGAYDEAQEKGQYFQREGITSQQLRDAGVDAADISWLESQGYLGTAPRAADTTITDASSGLPDYSNMVNPFTGETFGSMDPALLVQAENEQKTLKNLTDQLLAGWQGLGENVGIGSAGTDQAEIGGRLLPYVAEDFARRLIQQGITDISQAKFDPGAQAAWTAEGKGNVSLVATADGRLIPVWGSSSDAGKARQLALAIGAALVAPGLSTALGGGIAGGAGAGAILGGGQAAIAGGDLEDILKGAFTGGLGGGITAGAGSFANSVGADVLASTGSQVLADAATAAVRAGAGALPRAITTGDFGNVLTAALTAGATTGAVGGVSELTGLSTKDINAAINFAQGAASGDLSKMLSSAASFTDNPDIEVASKAVRLVQAIESGDPSRIVSAGQAFGRELDGYNTRQTIEKAYQDPTRALDTITGSDLRDAALRTVPGSEDLTTQDLIDIVNAPGQAATTAPTVKTTAPITTAATTTAAAGQMAATTTQGDASSLPAFNRATITTLPQSRAAEIIAELYPGQSLDWVDQGVLNAAASHIRADDEAGLRARLAAGQPLGTGDAISGDRATDYRAPAGTRVAQPGENAGMLGYTETGTPVNLIQQLGTTARKMTPEEAFAYDVANAGESIDPLTGQPYEVSSSPEALALANVIRGPVSSVAAGVGEQAKLLGVAGGWITGDRDNALKQWGSNVESWANSITPDSVKRGQDEISKSIAEADGLPAKAWAAVKGAATNPLATLHWIGKEGIQEVLPLGSAVAVGRAVSGATKLKYGEDLAQRIGLGSAITTDATMNAGESATASYEEVYNTLRDRGVSEDKASSAAAAAAAGSGAVTLFTAAIGDAALVKQLMNNIKGATINATLKEGPTEFAEGALQSVVEDNATNVALGKGLVFDPNKALTSGTIEALIGTGTTATISKGADVFTPAVETGAGSSQATAISTPAAPATAAPAVQTRTEPTFDPGTVVATDSDTGDAVTLGELTGTSVRDAGTSTRIDPTLEALEGTDLDSQQIISDYVNEVLGGSAPKTGTDQDAVIGTDPDTGQAVTLSELGLTGPATTAPTTTVPAASTAPIATAAATATTAPATAVAADTTTATSTDTKTTTDPNTGATTTTATDPNTGTKTTTTTDPNTGTETNTATDPNTGSTTTTQTDPNANTATTTNTDPNTNTSTSTTTDANTNTSTTTNTDANTNTTTSVETNQNTGVTTNTSTTPDTNTTTTTDPNTNTTTTTETNTDTGTSTTTTVDTTTGKVVDTNVDEPPPLPPGEDVLPPVTEEELRTIVAGPPPAPTPAPPAPTPAPAPRTAAPAVKAPTRPPSPAAQLAQTPGMTPELANFIQALMQTEEADLEALTMVRKEEREQKRKDVRSKLKSRKA